MSLFTFLKNRHAKKKTTIQKCCRPTVECLEDRVLLASSFFGGVTTRTTFNNYNLTYGLDGTNNDDTITIDYGRSASKRFKPVVVTVKNGNTVVRQRSFWSVPGGGLVIRGLDGDDTITNNTSLPMKIYGGKGDDHLIGGAATDRLYGEAGKDHLEGRGGRDYLYGGAEDDTLDGGKDGINDYLYGGSGKDTFAQYVYVRCGPSGCDYDDPAAVEDRAYDFKRSEGDAYSTEYVELFY